MFNWFNLGKKSRSKFGKWIDSKRISQIELEKESGLSRGTISRLCNDDGYIPKIATEKKILKALKKIDGSSYHGFGE
ncbi:helix-turn-helix domain-containing protein [Bacillus pseudomycoides]|uniref:helix-turn-helix domain-containing protein n=1 Tax=Bacillus pseudomycoides TaxID=64104 RepID=UPI000BECF794|nr:helix-turn-helix transcriptional regulator [Bacillus pseudomycoides]PEE42849.1 transcriptional regulator [Bacillus pseudomycoides]PGA90912.1 transcriptional regulator [Bacillus pseudomycoides]